MREYRESHLSPEDELMAPCELAPSNDGSDCNLQVFQTFSCAYFDDIDERYLWADFRIRCDTPTHKAYMVYAAVMVVVCEWLALSLARDTPAMRIESRSCHKPSWAFPGHMNASVRPTFPAPAGA